MGPTLTNVLRETVAHYSNHNPTVDVFASGSVATGQDQNVKTTQGTSLSCTAITLAPMPPTCAIS